MISPMITTIEPITSRKNAHAAAIIIQRLPEPAGCGALSCADCRGTSSNVASRGTALRGCCMTTGRLGGGADFCALTTGFGGETAGLDGTIAGLDFGLFFAAESSSIFLRHARIVASSSAPLAGRSAGSFWRQ